MAESSVRIIPLGVGNAFSARHYTTSFALGAGDDWILIDCPHPIRKMLREASIKSGVSIDLGQIRGVLLSHLHADHACGLEDYSYYNCYILKRKAELAAHPEVLSKLWTGLLSAGMSEVRECPGIPSASRTLEDFFDLTLLDNDRPRQFGAFTIESRFTIHSVPTTAFRIQAAGRTLGFSADSAFDPSLIDWLSSADLILHEVTNNLEATAVHTHFKDLQTLPEELKSKMRLSHYPDDFDAEACGINLLVEGDIYPI